jgi:hypothetical protein
LRPASRARSSPGWKLPLEAWPPLEAMSLCEDVSGGRQRAKTVVKTYLLPGVHAGETTLVAGLASLASNALDLLLRAVGKVSGVLVSGHFELIEVGD